MPPSARSCRCPVFQDDLVRWSARSLGCRGECHGERPAPFSSDWSRITTAAATRDAAQTCPWSRRNGVWKGSITLKQHRRRHCLCHCQARILPSSGSRELVGARADLASQLLSDDDQWWPQVQTRASTAASEGVDVGGDRGAPPADYGALRPGAMRRGGAASESAELIAQAHGSSDAVAAVNARAVCGSWRRGGGM